MVDLLECLHLVEEIINGEWMANDLVLRAAGEMRISDPC
jgi:hypothetical protein